MNIRELAALCGVSPATVSRCFSGQEGVGAETRSRIMETARRAGYYPPEGYRSRRKSNAVIAVLTPGFHLTFFDDVLAALRLQSEAIGKQLAILPIDTQDPKRTLSLLKTLQPTGVILLDERTAAPIVDVLSRENQAVVVCGARAIGQRFSSVHIDDMIAAYDGMRYLIHLGHQRIGILSDDSHQLSAGFQRTTGCKRAMEDARLPLPEEWIVYRGTRYQDGYDGMEHLLHTLPTITAVFAFSDDVAAGAISRLRDEGKRVPEDVSVLGFDDSTMARRVRPQLTTLRQPIEQIASKSLDYLLAHQCASAPSSLTLPCTLIERDSCQPPRAETEP